MAKLVQPDRPIWPPFPDAPDDMPPPADAGLQGEATPDPVPQAAERKDFTRPLILPGS